MPELPDVTVYVEHLGARVTGETLRGLRWRSPFVLRTVEPRPDALVGRAVTGVERLGKRIVLACAGELFLVLHLMVAGRLRWRPSGAPVPRRDGLAAVDFTSGSLLLTEASRRKRASVHVVAGRAALAALDRGGLEVAGASAAEFAARLRARNHTLKRALTDPAVLSGIGNAYSDEILFAARLSPFRQTRRLDDDELARLHRACRDVLAGWTERLRAAAGERFPEKVTAFHEGMAVHGKYRRPCPRCGAPIQRVVYAENEANYCPGCQTGGRVLADRALSRLLKESWPRTLAELGE